MEKNSRLIQLDVLRCCAILLVMGTHFFVPYAQAGCFQPLARWLHVFGWTGVDLFFVLSGFLIGGILFGELRRTGKLDFKRFIIRRGMKIWPLYYLYLLFAARTLAHKEHTGFVPAAGHLWSQILHIQNYFLTPVNANVWSLLGHTWTLAVEEHFYLALPLLLALLTARPVSADRALRFLPVIACCVMAACLLLRVLCLARISQATALSVDPRIEQILRTRTHLRIDSLFFGVLLAYLWRFKRIALDPLLRRPFWLLGAGIVLLSPMWFSGLADSAFVSTLGFTLLYLGYGCILLAVMSCTLPEHANEAFTAFFNSRFARALAAIGVYSYPIYLLHFVIPFETGVWLWRHWLPHAPLSVQWGACFVWYVVCGVCLGAAAGILIERPVLAARNRLFPA